MSSLRTTMVGASHMHAFGYRWISDQRIVSYVGQPRQEHTVALRNLAYALQWAHYGFQTIEPGAKLSASLMATSGMRGLIMPWDAFAVIVPVGMIWIDGKRGPAPVDAIFVRNCFGAGKEHLGIGVELCLISDADGGPMAHLWSESLDTMAEDAGDAELSPFERELAQQDRHALGDFTDLDRRAFLLSSRFVLGCIAELTALREDNRIRIGERSPARPSEPKLSTWRLTRKVVVDVRAECAEFCRGGGKAPSVRTMVRGHWKHQAYGGGVRRIIHVEPYWRGPEDGAIAVRPHVLKGGAT